MIKSFKNKSTADFCQGTYVKAFDGVPGPVADRKIRMLEAASQLDDLLVPPGNRLEALKGDREGQHSIRINQQWRLCFVWDEGVTDLELVDYHKG